MDKVKTIAILGLAAMVLSLCGAMAGVANTAEQFAPIPQATAAIALDRRQQEAQVTATYIAVLKSEVVSDTMTTHGLQRERERERHSREQAMAETWLSVKQFGAWVVTVNLSIACIALSIRFGAGWAMNGIHSARKATMPLPQLSRPLADGAHLLADGRATDTRSLASWSVVGDMQPTIEQAQALAEIRRVVYGDIARILAPLLEGGQKQLTRGEVEV